jgi:predicted nucleotidyltransferase
VFREFGMVSDDVTPELFVTTGNIVRMGVPPVRIEIFTDVDGVDFAKCAATAKDAEIDGVPVRLISLVDLRTNKKASGRYKDLDDLDHLPESE